MRSCFRNLMSTLPWFFITPCTFQKRKSHYRYRNLMSPLPWLLIRWVATPFAVTVVGIVPLVTTEYWCCRWLFAQGGVLRRAFARFGPLFFLSLLGEEFIGCRPAVRFERTTAGKGSLLMAINPKYLRKATAGMKNIEDIVNMMAMNTPQAG